MNPDTSTRTGTSPNTSPGTGETAHPSTPRPPRVHVVAMASHETPGLTNLRTSARLAGLGSGPGVEQKQGSGSPQEQGQGEGEEGNGSSGDSGTLGGHTFTVVGLGEPYSDYTDKIVALHAHLHATHKHPDPSAATDPALDPTTSSSTSSPAYLHPDDDVVVIVDAYDVLLLPAIRMAPAFLASSSAPLVFCAENGGYPEFAFASLYQRGAHRVGAFQHEPEPYFASEPGLHNFTTGKYDDEEGEYRGWRQWASLRGFSPHDIDWAARCNNTPITCLPMKCHTPITYQQPSSSPLMS